MRFPGILTLGCGLALTACCGQAVDTPPLLVAGFENQEGLSLTFDAANPASAATLNADPRFVSQGETSLHLASVSRADAAGNTYLGVMVRLAEPVSLVKRALLFDAWTTEPENTRALYVRGYDTEGRQALSWATWASPVTSDRKHEITLVPAVSLPGMPWESQVVVSDRRDAIARLEFIIGTSRQGVPYSIYLDHVRLVPSDVTSFLETAEVKARVPNTPLLAGGEAAAAILAPDGDEWGAVALDLQAALRDRLGAAFPILGPDRNGKEDLGKTPLIALGTVVNNRRLLYLYSHMHTYADDLYPGPDGHVVQSIHDPWGTGHNVLLIGASTLAGARAGMAALLETIPVDGVVPPVFRVALAGVARERFGAVWQQEPDEPYLARQRQAAEDSLRQGAHGGLFSQMVSVGSLYLQTRKDGYALLFAWLARRAKEHHDSAPGTFGGPWGMDSDFRIHNVLPMWDGVEESPALSDDDRLEVTRILFQWVSDVAPRKTTGAVGSDHVRHNHQTFPALGLLFAGEYFTKHYKAAEGQRWLEIADAVFQMQSLARKPHEDCNGYQWLTLYHTMQYALARQDFTFFANGNARACADFAVLSMDNLGYPVTYGDCPPWSGWWSEVPFLRGARWYYGDRRYAWVLEKKEQVSGRPALGQYTVTDRAALPAPTDLLGAIAWPLDPHYHRSWRGPDSLAVESAVDKVVFRNSFDPADQYLLLDGLSNGGHGHMDGNAISRWTQNGRIWLADSDYILSLPKYHCGVLVLRDGQSARIPPFVRLERIADLPSFGASTTVCPDYAGVDWRRTILWLKGTLFLVADEMRAQEDGEYSFRVVWNTVGEVELTAAGLAMHQDGQHAAIALSPDLRLALADDRDYGKNWRTYPFIREPVVRVFQGIRNVTLRAGQQATLFSLLHASGEKPSAARLVRLDEHAVAVTGLGEPILVGLGGTAGTIRGPEAVEIAAAAAVATPGRLFALGATRISGLGPDLRWSTAADVELDLGTGLASLQEPARTAAAEPPGVVTRQADGIALAAEDVRAAMTMAIAGAPAAPRPTAAALSIPRTLDVLWSHRETLKAYLLTGNAGAFEAVPAGLSATATPDPLAANVFSGATGQNRLDGLFDGQLLTTEGSTMWDVDQPVVLTLTFDHAYDLDRIALRHWHATSSSKQKLFQLGTLKVVASNDGFDQDSRTILTFTDQEEHGNWGAPGYGPQPYAFAVAGVTARSLRLHLEPRPGTAIYLAEVEVWGNRDGLELDHATLQARAVPVHAFPALALADLGGDGVQEVIAGSTNGCVEARDAAGTVLWSVPTAGAVNALAAVDFAGNGRPAIVAGSMDATVTAISPAGEVLWTFSVPYYKRTGHVRTVFPANLTGDGRQAAIVGADNWHYYALDAAGKELWRYESVHGSTVGVAADLTGNGRDEVLAGTEYYWWHGVQPDGKRLFQYNTRGGPHAKAVTAAALDADGTRAAVFGGADGNVHALGAAGNPGSLRWLFNTGDEVLADAAADIDGDGRDEILAGSMSFNVYAIDAGGALVWRRDLGAQVTRLRVAQTAGGPTAVLAGCADGTLAVLDARTGRIVAGRRFEAPILEVAVESTGRAAVVSTGDGRLTRLDLTTKAEAN